MLVLQRFVRKSLEKFDGCSKIISTTQRETDICVRQSKHRVSHVVLSVSIIELEPGELQSVISGRYQQSGSQKVGSEVGKKKAQNIEHDGGLITVGPITTKNNMADYGAKKTITCVNI